jgi:hypothetical protein
MQISASSHQEFTQHQGITQKMDPSLPGSCQTSIHILLKKICVSLSTAHWSHPRHVDGVSMGEPSKSLCQEIANLYMSLANT